VHTNIITFLRSIRTDVRCHHIHSFGGLQSATYVPYHLRSSIRTDVRCHHILLLDCCFCFIITKGKYQQIFHFGPSLPGILTRPHRVTPYVTLRPFEDRTLPSAALVDIPAPGWLCARRSRAGSSHSHRGVQVLGILHCRDVAGQPCTQVIRSVTAAPGLRVFRQGH